MLAGHGYGERDVQLAPGDLLFFYTDGCVEMENEAGDMFGSDRLEALVSGRRARQRRRRCSPRSKGRSPRSAAAATCSTTPR